jgi:poly-gamma-glutamate synthesis protein (capsule biosynthesis protein)
MAASRPVQIMAKFKNSADPSTIADKPVTLFLCGDVMTGRGIDQVLPFPGDPLIHESYMKSAQGYVHLAERVNGPIPKPVEFDWIWGDALEVLRRAAPDLRIINLETSITVSNDFWPRKGINYRMHPGNTPCITAAGIDCCALANNHVLDWGYAGLEETLESLEKAGIQAPGAGHNLGQAQAPVIFETTGSSRVIVFSAGSESSGVPPSWAATHDRAGVNYIDFSEQTADRIAQQVQAVKQSGDIVVMSIHWGGNWGYRVTDAQRGFAHRLIDDAGIDVIHGHSSHHPRGIEIYRNRPIIYGCGDFVNDYEGIQGHEEFRGDLSLMYFPTMDPRSGELTRFELNPMRITRFQLQRATTEEAAWLAKTLDRESKKLGARVQYADDRHLLVTPA